MSKQALLRKAVQSAVFEKRHIRYIKGNDIVFLDGAAYCMVLFFSLKSGILLL